MGTATPTWRPSRERGTQNYMEAHPDVAEAVADVDLSLIEARLRLTPLERVRHAMRTLCAVRRFRRVPPEHS